MGVGPFKFFGFGLFNVAEFFAGFVISITVDFEGAILFSFQRPVTSRTPPTASISTSAVDEFKG